MKPPPAVVSQLLVEYRNGNRGVLEQLMPLVYDELRRIAARHLRRERGDHTLQPTALVNEAYLRLAHQKEVGFVNRAHFMGIAARLMRQILVDHARTHGREKRGGGQARVTLNENLVVAQGRDIDLLALDDALRGLAGVEERLAQVVELRYFGGLSIEETAEVMDTSPATVKRDWTMAKAYLRREMLGGKTR